jgi:hypothetical protein
VSTRLADQIPEPEPAQDVINVTGMALLNFVPIVGAPLSSIVGGALAVQSDKRNRELLSLIAAVVDDLASSVEDLTVESITSDPIFIASTEKVVRAARESANDEHRRRLVGALRNAGAWSAFGEHATETMTLLLVGYQPLHLVLLHFFNNPRRWWREGRGPTANKKGVREGPGLAWTMENAFFALKTHVVGDDVSFYELNIAFNQLVADQLLEVKGSPVDLRAMSASVVNKPMTTHRGKELLSFLGIDVRIDSDIKRVGPPTPKPKPGAHPPATAT